MAEIVMWNGVNKILACPPGEEESRIRNMPVFTNGHMTVSCWKLSKEELKEIIDHDGEVYLAVLFGPSSPPTFVGSYSKVRELSFDFGGSWPKIKFNKDTCDNG